MVILTQKLEAAKLIRSRGRVADTADLKGVLVLE